MAIDFVARALAAQLKVAAGLTQKIYNVRESGAVGDGVLRTLATRFASLAQAQAAYPRAVSLADPLDWHAIQSTIDKAVSAGGGVVYLPQGRYMCTGARSALIFPLMADTSASPFSATACEVSMIGDSARVSGLVWGADAAGSAAPNDHYGIMCGQIAGDPINQQMTSRYGASNACQSPGEFRDFYMEGPAKSLATGANLGVAGCNMSGICWAARRRLTNLRIDGFWAGIDVVGDHTTFTNVQSRNSFYGMYINHNSPFLYGDLVITGKSLFDNCRLASIGFAYGGAMGTWHLTERTFIGNSPYGFFKEATPASPSYSPIAQFLAGVQMDSPFFEGLGNAVIWDDNFRVNGACASILDGVVMKTPSLPGWQNVRRITSRPRCIMLVGTVNGVKLENMRKVDPDGCTRPLFDIQTSILGSFVLNGDIELLFNSCSTLVNPFSQAVGVTVQAGGTGYAVGDTIMPAGGTLYTPGTGSAVLKVATVDANGGVTRATLYSWGMYSALPANPVAQASTTGTGTGAAFNFTGSQAASPVRPPSDLYAPRVEFEHVHGDGSCGPWKGRLYATYAAVSVGKNLAAARVFYGVANMDGRSPTASFAGITRTVAYPLNPAPSGAQSFVAVAESGIDIPVSVVGGSGLQELRKVNQASSGGQLARSLSMSDGVTIGWANAVGSVCLFPGCTTAMNPVQGVEMPEAFGGMSYTVQIGDWGKRKLISSSTLGVATLAPNAAGTGYAVNDVVTLAGGTLAAGGVAATGKVTSIGANGAITGISVVNPGQYTAIPTNPIAQAGTTGTGTGATFTATLGGSDVPVTLPNARPVGFIVRLVQYNIGALVPTAEAGATLSMSGIKSAGRYRTITATVVANATGTSAEWLVEGTI